MPWIKYTSSKSLLLFFVPAMLFGSWLGYEYTATEYGDSTNTENLFVYGTLKNPWIRFYACRCVIQETPASLSGYKKIGLNIIPEESSVVYGKLLKVTQLELKRLDAYENTPRKYQRVRVTLSSGEEAWVYVK